MPRWIKQRNSYSCGPVAMLNVLKWAGLDVSYNQHFEEWSEHCRCDETGTNALGRALKKLSRFVLVGKPESSNLRRIKSQAKRGCGIILYSAAFDFTEPGLIACHLSFIPEATKYSVFMTNGAFGHSYIPDYFFKQDYLGKWNVRPGNERFPTAPIMWACERK